VAGSEEDAEALAEAGDTSSAIEGTTVGPPAAPTVLAVAPNALTFVAKKLGPGGPLVSVTPPTAIGVSFTGASPTWTATATPSQAWLHVSNGSGSGAGQFIAYVGNAGNAIGGASVLSATITVSAPTAGSIDIPVTLNVQDVVTPVAFTDDPLIAATTVVNAIHLIELRLRIDALRVRAHLSTFTWNDSLLVPGLSVIRAQDILDLRAALNDVYAAASKPLPVYTDPNLGSGTLIKVVHVAELRSAVMAIE
jgi:hypothetical protein